MYFTINTAFANYLDVFPNLTISFFRQTLPLNLSISGFDKSLLHVPTNLKDFIKSYAKDKEIFDLKERHVSTILNTSKYFFPNNYVMDIFVFASSMISLMSTTLIIYLLGKHKQIRSLIASLVLHQIKEVSVSSTESNSECKTLAYIGIILTMLSLMIVTFLHYKKSGFVKDINFHMW